MSSDWKSFQLPLRGGILRGENNIDALTKDIFQTGWFSRVRNYHIKNGFQKREGTQAWQGNSTAQNGSNAVQSLAMYDWSGTRHLIAVSNGNLYRNNSGLWSNITGALTIASGADRQLRWCQFHDGTNAEILGTDNVNTPFKWTGSGNGAILGGTPPTQASDIAEFQGRVWAINTDAGATAVEYSDDGTEDSWSAGQLFHCTRAVSYTHLTLPTILRV